MTHFSVNSCRLIIIVLAIVLLSTHAHARSANKLSPYVQKLLLQAQQVIAAPNDNDKRTVSLSAEQLEEQSTAAIKKLTKIELNDYEETLFHKLQASIHLHKSDYESALPHFEKAWSMKVLEEPEQRQLQHIIAQLAFSQEQWNKAIIQMEDWISYTATQAEKPNAVSVSANDYLILAQSHAKQEQWTAVISPINMAITLKNPAPESWYQLALASHQQLGQNNESISVLQTVLAIYPNMRYWEQLAATYQKAEQYNQALTALRAAYIGGFIKKENHYIWLTQLAMQQNVPLRGAEVLSTAIESGQVKNSTENLKLLANAWLLAKHYKESATVIDQLLEQEPDNEKMLKLRSQLDQHINRT